MTNKLIESTLEQKNWTGLTFRELLELGRASVERGVVLSFMKAANGEPGTIDQLTQYRRAVEKIQAMYSIA